MVVGALIPTVINATVKAKYVAGKLVVNGQHVLDSILPGMIPVLLVLLVYWLLGKEAYDASTYYSCCACFVDCIIGNRIL